MFNTIWAKKLLISKTQLLNKSFFILCCLITALLIMRDVGGVNMSKWVFLFLSICAFIIFDINYLAIFLCFLIPYIVGLPNSYIFIIGLCIFIIKNFTKIEINRYLIGVILIFIVELMSFIYGTFSIDEYIRFVAPLLLISLIIFNKRYSLDHKRMLFYFLFASIGAELSVTLQSISVNGLDSLISSGVRLGDTSQLLLEEGMRITYNPNSLGLLCALCISILLVLFSRGKQNKLIIAALLVFQIFIGSMSLSRSFIILLLIIALIYGLSIAKSIRGFLKGIALISIVTLGVYTSINYYSPSLLASFSTRLTVNDISNGRLEIATLYFDILAQHPERIFLGVGLQDYPNKYGMSIESHNGLQEVLITWGVVGIFLVAVYIYGIFKYGWRGVVKKDRKIIYLLPLIVIIVGVQSGQFFYSGNSALYFLPAYATMRLATRNG
jgi:Predicted membrane-associated, metal-dependent hydrolase